MKIPNVNQKEKIYRINESNENSIRQTKNTITSNNFVDVSTTEGNYRRKILNHGTNTITTESSIREEHSPFITNMNMNNNMINTMRKIKRDSIKLNNNIYVSTTSNQVNSTKSTYYENFLNDNRYYKDDLELAKIDKKKLLQDKIIINIPQRHKKSVSYVPTDEREVNVSKQIDQKVLRTTNYWNNIGRAFNSGVYSIPFVSQCEK